MKTGYIYALVHPVSRKIYYVGRTKDLSIRYSDHLSLTIHSSYHDMYKHFRRYNIIPEMMVLEVMVYFDKKEFFEREREWIRGYSEQYKLFNKDCNSRVFIKEGCHYRKRDKVV